MMKPFFYVIRSSSSINSGASDIQTITLATDSDFDCTEIRTSGTNNCLATIAYSSGDQWSSSSINCGVIGAGLNGMRFTAPMRIARGTQITVTFTNNTGGGISTAQEVLLCGHKI